MPNYIFLCKFTTEGARGIRQAAERRQRGRAMAERFGGRIVSTWSTQGRYDVVILAEFPDEVSASAYALGVASAGNLSTETMRAFSEQEMDAIIAKLPS